MNNRRKLLFVQLPYIDNQVGGQYENLRLAGIYLSNAMDRSGEGVYFTPSICPHATDRQDDSHLVDYIVLKERPAVIAATLYLWNVERTLDVLSAVKKRLPSVRILAGGPEVAPDHPFLFKTLLPDAVAAGEGEQLFPLMLKALRTGRKTDLSAVAWRTGGKYDWGKGSLPRIELADLLPPPSFMYNRPDASGIAYMESSRGCPLKCAFCCYNQKRRGVSYLPAQEVVKRASILVKRGAKEIRFVDPTFNSNLDFENILRGLISINPRRRIAFFAELRAEAVTKEQAELLWRANFKEIEVGVQSRDPAVLRAIRRPGSMTALDRGVRLMSGRGIRLTVDIMCGLPFQGLMDIRKSLRWAFAVKKGYVQFLHTLMIPGTELRGKRKDYALVSQDRPPYRVVSTGAMSAADMRLAEKIARGHAGRLMDSPATRFAGIVLRDLFFEKTGISADGNIPAHIPGRTNRRALLIRGAFLYARKDAICRIIRQAITDEPHTLWQFVLCPQGEEPLDLLDSMFAEINSFRPHLLDNMAVVPDGSRLVARRVFVQLSRDARYGRAWVTAVEDALRACYY